MADITNDEEKELTQGLISGKPKRVKTKAKREPTALTPLYNFMNGKTQIGYVFEEVMTLLIWAVVIAYIFITCPEYADAEDSVNTFALVANIVFLIEYLLRLIASSEDPNFGYSRTKYFFSFFSFIDLFTTVPFIAMYCINADHEKSIAFIRVLKLFTRFATDKNNGEAGDAVRAVVKQQAIKIWTFVYFLFGVWMMLACCYYITDRDNSELDGRFDTLTGSIWWTLVFLMGEYPVNGEFSYWGKIFIIINNWIAIAGVHGIATGIIAEGFQNRVVAAEEIKKLKIKLAKMIQDQAPEEKLDEIREQIADLEDGTDDDDEDDEEEEVEFEEVAKSLSGVEAQFKASGVKEDSDNAIDKLFIFINGHSTAGAVFEGFVLLIVVVNVLSSTLDTCHEIKNDPSWKEYWKYGEPITLSIFTVEYFLRLIAIGAHQDYNGWKRIVWMFTDFYSIVDLLAITPYWVDVGMNGWDSNSSSTSFVRVLRIFRVFRVFSFRKFVEGTNVLWNVLMDKLSLILQLMYGCLILLVFFSSLMYWTDRNNDLTKVAKEFNTVPKAMWITLLNFTGEYPIGDYTPLGRLVSTFVCFVALTIFGIAPAILGDGIGEELDKLAKYKEQCKTDKDKEEEKEEKEKEEEDAKKFDELRSDLEKTGLGQFSLFMEGQSLIKEDETEEDPWWEVWGFYFQIFIMAVILLNTTVFVCSTVDDLNVDPWKEVFKTIEAVSVIFFTFEYVLRLIAAFGNPHYHNQWYGSARFCGHIFSFFGIFDLLSIVPWYVGLCIDNKDLKNFVIFRAFRLLRILRIERYLGAFEIFAQVFSEKAISLIISGFMLCIWTLVFATLLHTTEKDNQETQAIGKVTMAHRFRSVPSSLFYTFIHLTGDYPLYKYTMWGRLVNVLMILVGQVLVGLPIGILIDGFQQKAEEISEDSEEAKAKDAALHASQEASETKEDEGDGASTANDDNTTGSVVEGLPAENPMNVSACVWGLWKNLHGKGQAGCYFNIASFCTVTIAFANMIVQFNKDWRNTSMFDHDEIDVSVGDFFQSLGWGCAGFFVVEWILRIVCAPADPAFLGVYDKEDDCTKVDGKKLYTKNNWKNMKDKPQLCYILDFMGIIDMLSFVCFFASMGFDQDTQGRVIFSSLQIVMLMKFDRILPAFTLLDDVVSSSNALLTCMLVLGVIAWIGFAALFYVTEDDNPNQKGSFANMPLSLFFTTIILDGEWCRTDLSEPWGEIVGVFMAIFGVGLIGIPAGIFFDAFDKISEDALEMFAFDETNCCAKTCNSLLCSPGSKDEKDSSSAEGNGNGSGSGFLDRDLESGGYGTCVSHNAKKPSALRKNKIARPRTTSWVSEGLAYEA
jgi:voltage-gated potassium channel